MSCPNCGMPGTSRNGFDCGSFFGATGNLIKSNPCKRITHLREMLLEALPCVQDRIDCVAYKESGRAKIADLAKRIENEVNT